MLVALVAVLLAAYYFTRFFAKKSLNLRGGKTNMRVLDRMVLTKDKSILVVEIYGRYYVLAVTNQNISRVDELDEETIAFFARSQEPYAAKGFSTILGAAAGNFFMLLKERLGLGKNSAQGGDPREAVQKDDLFHKNLLSQIEGGQDEGDGLEAMTRMMAQRSDAMKNRDMTKNRDVMQYKQKNKEDEDLDT